MPQLWGAFACGPMMKSTRRTKRAISSGSLTAPRFDMQRQDLHSPTASNTAFMAMFLMNSGMMRRIGMRSLATFVSIFAAIIRRSFSRPIR